MSELRCVRFVVRGRVQGVFYRASAQQTARQLGVTGWVRNCDDGSVELLACGVGAQLAALEQWLWEGPPRAQVTEVAREDAAVNERHLDFAVRG